jgi:hypothetical protein
MKIGLVSAHHNLGTIYFEYEENPVEISGTLIEIEIRTLIPYSSFKLLKKEKLLSG